MRCRYTASSKSCLAKGEVVFIINPYTFLCSFSLKHLVVHPVPGVCTLVTQNDERRVGKHMSYIYVAVQDIFPWGSEDFLF